MFQSGILEQNITKKMFCLCFLGGGEKNWKFVE